MQTIKIFLASSNELAEERIRFGDFIRNLDNTYESRGIRIKLFKWEDLPSGDNGRPKQDEYNDKVRECDMFIGLFHTLAGKYTLEEYDTAKATQKNIGKPILYVFCRKLAEGEREKSSLKQFKRKLTEEVKYFWIKYDSTDSLQLHFVLQLLKVENSRWNDLKVESGTVRLGNVEIARMDNLRFAADNEEYQRMSKRLKELPDEIDDARLLAKEHPDKERYKEKLQKLIDEGVQLQDKFNQQQQLLMDTAIRIAQFQGESISDNRKRAEEAFESGDLQTANFLLKEAERNGDLLYEDYERNEALQMERKKNIHQTIDDLLLQATTIMADITLSIEERINKAIGIYQKADHRADATDYNKEKYSNLLFDYAQFLYKYGLYGDAKTILLRQISLAEDLYGKENIKTASSYNEIGLVYWRSGEYEDALSFLSKALATREAFSKEHPNIAESYNNIGAVYKSQGNFAQALKNYTKALAIIEIVHGAENPVTATSYSNIGLVFKRLRNYDEALKYYFKALEIREKLLDMEHPDMATSYNNIGELFRKQSNYAKALEYHFKALAIRENVFGNKHPDTAQSYNNIGTVYYDQCDYTKALDFHIEALKIREIILGTEHPATAQSYNNIGRVYNKQKNHGKALEYHFKALAICEKTFGTNHPYTASTYNNIGAVYDDKGDYDNALANYLKALAIREKVLGREHLDTAQSYNNIGGVYRKRGDHPTSLVYYTKAYQIRKIQLGDDHPNTKGSLKSINFVKEAMKSSSKK